MSSKPCFGDMTGVTCIRQEHEGLLMLVFLLRPLCKEGELGQRRAMKSVFIENAGPSSALLAAFSKLTGFFVALLGLCIIGGIGHVVVCGICTIESG